MAQNAWTGLQQSTAHLPALGMGMMQMKENQINKDAALGIAQERNALAQQHEARMEEQARLQTEAARANIPQHRKVFNPSLVPQVSVATQKAYGKNGLTAFQPMLDTVKEIASANPESTFGDVYAAAKSAYPAHREEMMGSIEKSLASDKLSETERKRLSSLYDAIVYDKTGDRVLGEGVFKNTARSMKMEEENSKAALQADRIASLEQRTADRIASSERNTDARIQAAADRTVGKGGGKKEEKPPKPPTSSDVARVRKMIQDAGSDPSADDITLIQEAANSIGYDYVVNPGGKRGIPGIDAEWANWKDEDTWTLVKRNEPQKAATLDAAGQLKGMEPGRYKIDGKEVKWDGTKVIK